jgi:hypothetical protein
MFKDFRHGPAKSFSAILDLTLFRDRNFGFANAATLAFSIGFNAMYIDNVLFLTQVWHYSTVLTGLALTPAPLLVTPIAIASGRIASKSGHRPLIAPGGLIFATAGFWQWSGLTAHPAYLSQWLPPTVLTGIGVGLTMSPLALHILNTESEQQHVATASAEESPQLSQNRYTGGLDTYLQVVIWQTTALSNERNDIDIERRRLEASVLLIKALGGGWDVGQLPKL